MNPHISSSPPQGHDGWLQEVIQACIDVLGEPPESPKIMEPLYRDPDGIPIFSSTQLDLYGLPDWHGYTQFRVVETAEDGSHMQIVNDIDSIQVDGDRSKWYHTITSRPVHVYSRLSRFIATLDQLLGIRGTIPPELALYALYHPPDPDPRKVWNSTRAMLKQIHKVKTTRGVAGMFNPLTNKTIGRTRVPIHIHARNYYNRIPSLLVRIGYPHCIRLPAGRDVHIRMDIIRHFQQLDRLFESESAHRAPQPGRFKRYFPNIRFIALKLLEHHGAVFAADIPFARTKRKLKSLNDTWDAWMLRSAPGESGGGGASV